MFKVTKQRAFNMSSVKDLIEIFDQIDFDPPYQRYGNVWSQEKKQLLIDSILNDYDIPKIYLHYITEFDSNINKSGKPYAIIDGKQRLLAIQQFVNGEYTLSEDFVYEKDELVYAAGLSYRDLASKFPELKYEFDKFQLDIVHIITNESEKIEEFFYRLNEGQPLNNAEKRNRIVGYVNTNIRRVIASNNFFISRFVSKRNRLQYEDLCLKLLVTEYSDKLISLSKKNLDDFVELNRNESDRVRDAFINLERNLEILNGIFVDNDLLLKSRSIIPVYYFFITRMVEVYDNVRAFLLQFEEIRKVNRVQKEPNLVLVEFDLRNQQGVNGQKSLTYRCEIINKYYAKFLELGVLNWDTRVVIESLDLNEM